MTTVRATYLIIGAALLLGGFVALMIALLAPPGSALPPGSTSAALSAGGDSLPLSVVGGLMAIFGVLSVGQDYRYRMLATVFTAQPRRGLVVAARLIVLAAIAASVALAVSVVAAALCWLLGRPPAHDVGTLRVAGAHVLLAVLWAWLGAGLGWATRSSAGAVSILLVGPLLIEPLLAVVGEAEGSPELRNALRWLPFAAARQALGRPFHATPDTIGALAGGLEFAAVTLAAVGCAWLLVQRRDA